VTEGRADAPLPGPLGLAAVALVLALAPAVSPPYPLLLLCYALVLGVGCLGLNLLLGATGLLPLGHAAFFGIGAYAGGFLFYVFDVWALEAYLVTGVATATALSALVGAFCVRATRIHFAIMSLAFGQMIHAAFVSGLVFRLGGDVGKGMFFVGYGGLYLPRFRILGREPPPEAFIPVFYYVILVTAVAAVAVLWRVHASPFGLALRAIGDNDVRAAFVGVPVRRYRWRAFVLAGAVSGLAGALHGELNRQITPEQLNWLFSAKLVLATILGGSRHFAGPLVGAAVLVGLEELAVRATLARGLVLGALLIATVLLAPGGVLGVAANLRARLRLRRASRG
jgi:branched-chain amino acid transport system permease protein